MNAVQSEIVWSSGGSGTGIFTGLQSRLSHPPVLKWIWILRQKTRFEVPVSSRSACKELLLFIVTSLYAPYCMAHLQYVLTSIVSSSSSLIQSKFEQVYRSQFRKDHSQIIQHRNHSDNFVYLDWQCRTEHYCNQPMQPDQLLLSMNSKFHLNKI